MKKILRPMLLVVSIGFFVYPMISFASSSGLVIEEFQVSGENAYDEYFVVANYGSIEQKLDGYYIARKSQSSTTYNTLFNGFVDFTLQPGGRVKIANPKYVGESDFLYTSTSYSLTADNSIVLFTKNKEIVDLVGYGEANLFEGTPTPSPLANQIYQRKDRSDTDDNFNDFELKPSIVQLDQNINKIQISEIYPAPATGEEEWFELYNPTNLEIDLNNTKICDGSGSIKCFKLDNYKVEPYGFLVLTKASTKITLNNDGDWLEFYDLNDNLLFESDNYSDAESDISFSLFGSSWDWTKKVTKGQKNVFVTTVEEEPVKIVKAKTTKKTKTPPKVSSVKTNDEEIGQEVTDEPTVKGAETSQEVIDNKKINSKQVGYGIIGLAIAIFCGYILWENKGRLREIYFKLIRRNN